ncbi:putative zinc-binding protein [Alkalimarinus alittae]|uniref:Zinc-binding protein n=1 Tax=Alkalimarinus alittae TaxID=2961619 RepID=A0ABY6N6P0_9ALTE|nr:putative zinc-binding protein [Alkalimarinus alittae]UZE97781.1 putative zinc-binding protein [Alkalimarinus alittae]
MKQDTSDELPLVYSCSGCSNIAQLANQIAIELDREQIAEMSCIAGVGGGVKPLVKKAQSGRKIISLDGCALHCVKHCLAQHAIESTHHYTLTDYGVKKRYHMDFSSEDVAEIKKVIINDIDN